MSRGRLWAPFREAFGHPWVTFSRFLWYWEGGEFWWIFADFRGVPKSWVRRCWKVNHPEKMPYCQLTITDSRQQSATWGQKTANKHLKSWKELPTAKKQLKYWKLWLVISIWFSIPAAVVPLREGPADFGLRKCWLYYFWSSLYVDRVYLAVNLGPSLFQNDLHNSVNIRNRQNQQIGVCLNCIALPIGSCW